MKRATRFFGSCFPLALTVLALSACRGSAGFENAAGMRPQVGAELQAYPAGVVSALRFEWPSEGSSVWSARVGYNASDRQDWAEHDDETGGGFGLGLGWRYWKDADRAQPAGRGSQYRGWHFGGRLDFWDLEIDWRDFGPAQSGRTDVLVAQPTLEAGYSWQTEKGHRIDLTFGLGAEINIDTEGEDVGEGAIALIGLSFMPSAR